MANRSFPSGFNSNLHRMVNIFCKITIGAAGVVTGFTGDHIQAVALNTPGGGTYDITLTDDNLTNIYHVSGTVVTTGGGAAEDLYVQVLAYNAAAAGGATVQIHTMTGAAETAPAATDELMVWIVASDSGLNP